MKSHQLQSLGPGANIALFVAILAIGSFASQHQTTRLTEQELINELFVKGVLKVSSGDVTYYRFLDPVLTSIAIDTAVAGTQYKRAWEINNLPILPNKINIFTINSAEWDFDSQGPICIFRQNAIYLPSQETIIIDVQAARAITRHVNESEVSTVATVIAWIIGHEVGHAVLGHRRSAFFAFDESGCEPSTLKRLIRLFSPWCWSCKDSQALELEADKFFMTQIMKASNGNDVMIGFLLPLIGNYFDNPNLTIRGDVSHPDHTVRAVRLLEHLACHNQPENLRGKLGDLVKLLLTDLGETSRLCSEEDSGH